MTCRDIASSCRGQSGPIARCPQNTDARCWRGQGSKAVGGIVRCLKCDGLSIERWKRGGNNASPKQASHEREEQRDWKLEKLAGPPHNLKDSLLPL